MATSDLDPDRPCWVPIPEGSDFGIHNLPFGVAAYEDGPDRVVVAIGDQVLDLHALGKARLLDLDPAATVGSLDHLLADDALGDVRRRIGDLLTDERHRGEVEAALGPRRRLRLRLPFAVADLVDFYASETHATAVGRLFRPHEEPLPPAWRSLPIGYHARAGTVVVSETPVRRPLGLRAGPDGATYGPSRSLDYELEVGAVVGRPSRPGVPVRPDEAFDHIAGFVLVNDWSARDIQAFEYRPLGPMLGKSFATSLSPWLVTREALAPYRVPPPDQRPPAPDHLRPAGPAFAVDLEADVDGHVVSRASFAGMYWTVAQQVAHLTSNGTHLRTGDILASGTVSDPTPSGAGCLLEATKDGAVPLHLPDGRRLAYLEDGDTVTLRARAGTGLRRVGFGTCRAKVLPAHPATTGDRP